jgi:hypothetical protein
VAPTIGRIPLSTAASTLPASIERIAGMAHRPAVVGVSVNGKMARCGLVWLLAATPVSATVSEFPSPTGGAPTPLLFAHPLVNYHADPQWIRAWEADLQSGNSLRVNVGSVSTDDLLTDVELHLTQPMGGRFRALYDMQWWETSHLETPGTQHFLGLEFAALPTLGLQLQAHPASRKEEMDMRAGLLLHDVPRRQYLRLLVRWDDWLFEEKNDRAGTSDQVAMRFEWTTRLALRRVEMFSRGHYGSQTRHSYPDSLASPDLVDEARGRGGSETRLRALFEADRFLELELLHHEYQESRTLRGAPVTDTYRNRIVDVAVRGLWGWRDRWWVRGELHRVDQRARRRGDRSYDYGRTDWMPALFVQRRLHAMHRLELGYLATAYDWTGSPEPSAPEQDGVVQKLELGWLIEFSRQSRLQVSVSHEPDPQRFGGGNIQLQLSF